MQSLSRRIRCAAMGLLSSKLTRNIGWLTGAELLSRLGRIATAVILARTLDATAFGIAALALTVFELMRIFTENGIGAAVVRASDDDLDATTNTAYKIMWIICSLLAGLQFFTGLGLTYLFPTAPTGWMVCALAGVFLIMPFGLMHAYVLQRAENMKQLSIVGSSQTIADHLLTALFALTGLGAWAIVLPKLLTSPIWLLGVRRGTPWQRNRSAGYKPARGLLQFSAPVLLSEIAVAAREQCDKLLVSVTFGIEALGLYYFAFNAGLGLSTALNRAFNFALYPLLCAIKTDDPTKIARYRGIVLLAAPGMSLVYGLQAFAALFYVPFIFGPDWLHAAPLVALICLSGPARGLLDSTRIYWRATGNTVRELNSSLCFACGVLAPFALFSAWGLTAAIVGSTTGATLTAIALAYPTLFPKRNHPTLPIQGTIT